MSRRTIRLTARRGLSAILFIQAVCACAAESMYYFTDERGVPHYSNQPLDPRYRPLGTAAAGEPRQPDAAATEVEISAPEQAALGEMFEVTVSMAKPPEGAGYLELSFDPETLSLQAISVEASVSEPGKVRIDLLTDAAQPGQALANLSFQAIASAPTQASVQVTHMELFDRAGKALPVQAGAWANVRLVQ